MELLPFPIPLYHPFGTSKPPRFCGMKTLLQAFFNLFENGSGLGPLLFCLFIRLKLGLSSRLGVSASQATVRDLKERSVGKREAMNKQLWFLDVSIQPFYDWPMHTCPILSLSFPTKDQTRHMFESSKGMCFSVYEKKLQRAGGTDPFLFQKTLKLLRSSL